MAWRDKIEVHAAANRFPMMSDAELDELASDIAKNWLRVGIVLWTPEKLEDVSRRKGPQKLYLLDGRNRLEAIERSGRSASEIDEEIDAALDPNAWPAPAEIIYGDVDPLAYVVSTNIRRRHLTAEQKREIIADLLKENPERSDRATAKIAGVHHETVAAVREEGERRGEIRHVDKRTDTAGRQQPARKPADVVSLPTAGAGVSRRTINAGEAKASDKRVDAFIRAAKNLSDEEFTIAANWFDEYRTERGGTVFDNTRSGRSRT